MKHLLFYMLAIFFLLTGEYQPVFACTNYIVTRGASADGSVMITYAADSHTLYGELYYRPAKNYPKGALLEVTEWDTGKPLGKIKQVPQTYAVVGNMNEHQVAIGETTFGGRPELQDTTGIIDYGSLIYITLQRAKTAREAIRLIDELTNEYGYYSSGESFSIADKNEAWIMEIIGKGSGNKGALWVAVRIPDGYVSGHANQARIQTFPLNDPENCLYSKDVISFARSKGWFNGEDKDFSFSDTYAPIDFSGARFCEIRVWSMFNKVNSDMAQYWDYATGHNLTKRMPLYIKPNRKISVSDMMGFMRDHLEGTELDMSKDFGAGPYGLPYRWRPLTWQVDSITYCNERATATQQTGFSFVTQSRSWLPDPVGGILWFGMDDASSSVYVPMYCGMNKIPQSFAEGNGDMLTYSETSAFWAFNYVANFCYLRYNIMIEDVKKVQNELESKFIKETAEVDKTASTLLKADKNKAIAYLTEYSVKAGNTTFKRWKELGHYLLVKYIDGNIKKEKDGKFLYNGYNQAASPLQPGYPESWKKKVVEETGDKLKVSGAAH